jgi:hypothetical protein
VAIARSIAEDGVRAVAATPHVRYDWPTTPEEMEQAVAVVQAAVQEADELEVLPGGEIALEELGRLDEAVRARFGLGGNPHRMRPARLPFGTGPKADSRLTMRSEPTRCAEVDPGNSPESGVHASGSRSLTGFAQCRVGSISV